MTQVKQSSNTDRNVDCNTATEKRLTRLAAYRTMQLQLEDQRRQQISRRRLLALRTGQAWGWVAL